jgi:hypothetical protein
MATDGNRGDVMVVSGDFDFTTLGDSFQNLETLSMLNSDGSTGNSTMTLHIDDVLQMADTGTADLGIGYSTEPTLRIDGDVGDTLNLANDSGTWLLATSVSSVPTGYTAYSHVTSGSTPTAFENAYLYVMTGVDVNGVGV